MSNTILFHSPKCEAPCGFELKIPFTNYASLKGCGAETLIIESCPKCNQEHRLPLNTLTEVVISIKPESGIVRAGLAGNGRQD